MCGRIVITSAAEAISRLFGTTNATINLTPSWNVAPTQQAPVVRRHQLSGERQLDLLHWGLVPHSARDLTRRPINARAETAATSGMFRRALASRRCIVVADAFYEWKAVADGKQPYAIGRQDGEPLAFAGLWDDWKASYGTSLRTFCILTTQANWTLSALHDRMPVILEPQDWGAWLGEEGGGDPARLLRPSGDDVLHLWPVSRAVNSVRNNGPGLLLPMAESVSQTAENVSLA